MLAVMPSYKLMIISLLQCQQKSCHLRSCCKNTFSCAWCILQVYIWEVVQSALLFCPVPSKLRWGLIKCWCTRAAFLQATNCWSRKSKNVAIPAWMSLLEGLLPPFGVGRFLTYQKTLYEFHPKYFYRVTLNTTLHDSSGLQALWKWVLDVPLRRYVFAYELIRR